VKISSTIAFGKRKLLKHYECNNTQTMLYYSCILVDDTLNDIKIITILGYEDIHYARSISFVNNYAGSIQIRKRS
jgi:hypothetical protein